jgi:hypothetical protein
MATNNYNPDYSGMADSNDRFAPNSF